MAIIEEIELIQLTILLDEFIDWETSKLIGEKMPLISTYKDENGTKKVAPTIVELILWIKNKIKRNDNSPEM